MTLVREFHEAFDLPRNDRPTPLDAEATALRLRLIKEEYEEVRDDLVVLLAHLRGGAKIDVLLDDLRRLLKELCDLRYVAEGTAVAFGLDIEAAYREVHRSNMSKLGEDGKPIYREDGKVMKGPGYFPADMEQFVPSVIEGTCQTIS